MNLFGLLLLLAPQQHPDIVHVQLGDLGWATGLAVPTPNLRELAREPETVGLPLYFAQPVGWATTMAGLFGVYPRRVGVHKSPTFYTDLLPGMPVGPTLPECLASAGYSTGLFGKWAGGRYGSGDPEQGPIRAGYHVWRAGIPGNVADQEGTGYDEWVRVDADLFGYTRTVETTWASRAIADEFLDWWAATPPPRYAFVYFGMGHGPYDDAPPPELLPPGSSFELRLKRGRYEAMVAALDQHVGEIVQRVGDQPIVIVSSATGTFERVAAPLEDDRKVKRSVYDGGIRVPALVRGGRGCLANPNAPTSSVDWPRTVAALAGLPPDPAWIDSIDRTVDKRTSVFAAVLLDTGWERCVRIATHKLRARQGKAHQLFDLVTDPDEEFPLPASGPVADALKALLASYP